jgi:hypothetical protein
MLPRWPGIRRVISLCGMSKEVSPEARRTVSETRLLGRMIAGLLDLGSSG